MLFKLSLIVGWIGGLFGIVRGLFAVIEPYAYTASGSSSAPGPPEVTPVFLSTPAQIVFGAFIAVIFGIPLILLSLRKRDILTGYVAMLAIIAVLGMATIA
jgi:hypothetical protein